MNAETLATGIVWYVVFLLSLTCHEAAHAFVAKLGGDPTAALGGQVTLNPIPHMRREIFGTIIVPILSYILGGWMIGWASAPYDPVWQYRHPRRAAWMALGGPMANLSLFLLAALAIRLLSYAGVMIPTGMPLFENVAVGLRPGFAEALATFLSILFSLNLLLGVFNLLPIPPLDGNTAIGLLLSEDIARRFTQATHNQSYTILGLIIGWRIFPYIFGPIFRFAAHLLSFGIVPG